MADTVSKFHSNINLVRSYPRPPDRYFLRADSFYNVANFIGQVSDANNGYGQRELHRQSQGESFLAVLNNKSGGAAGTASISSMSRRPCRLMTSLASIHDSVMDGSQFIFATHSPIARACPRGKIVFFDDGGLSDIHYEVTEHYSVTGYFLNNDLTMVKKLMRDD